MRKLLIAGTLLAFAASCARDEIPSLPSEGKTPLNISSLNIGDIKTKATVPTNGARIRIEQRQTDYLDIVNYTPKIYYYEYISSSRKWQPIIGGETVYPTDKANTDPINLSDNIYVSVPYDFIKNDRVIYIDNNGNQAFDVYNGGYYKGKGPLPENSEDNDYDKNDFCSTTTSFSSAFNNLTFSLNHQYTLMSLNITKQTDLNLTTGHIKSVSFSGAGIRDKCKVLNNSFEFFEDNSPIPTNYEYIVDIADKNILLTNSNNSEPLSLEFLIIPFTHKESQVMTIKINIDDIIYKVEIPYNALNCGYYRSLKNIIKLNFSKTNVVFGGIEQSNWDDVKVTSTPLKPIIDNINQ